MGVVSTIRSLAGRCGTPAVNRLNICGLIAVGLGETTLNEYSDLVVSLFETQIPGFEFLSQENVQTTQGLDAVRIEYLARQQDFHGSRLIIFDDNNLAINFSIHTTSKQYEIMNEMIDYIFDSFRSE